MAIQTVFLTLSDSLRRKIMQKRKLTCIGCPLGCQVTVELENKEILSITGNTCKRGEAYARGEVTNPVRTVTGTVRVCGGSAPVVSVKTKTGIPKDKISACARELKEVCVQAPVEIGDVLIAGVAGTGVDVIATKTVL